jgi:hypothetical protein
MASGRTEKPENPLMRLVENLTDTRSAYRICLLAAAISVLPAVCSYAGDLNQNLKSPLATGAAQATPQKGGKTVPQASPVGPNASGAEIVGKLLANPPSDPDVPLPQSNLATRPPTNDSLDHPTIFGRQEDGGGVFGLKIPIPADRSASDRHTRSSGSGPASD